MNKLPFLTLLLLFTLSMNSSSFGENTEEAKVFTFYNSCFNRMQIVVSFSREWLDIVANERDIHLYKESMHKTSKEILEDLRAVNKRDLELYNSLDDLRIKEYWPKIEEFLKKNNQVTVEEILPIAKGGLDVLKNTMTSEKTPKEYKQFWEEIRGDEVVKVLEETLNLIDSQLNRVKEKLNQE